jgi:hypothetical protein
MEVLKERKVKKKARESKVGKKGKKGTKTISDSDYDDEVAFEEKMMKVGKLYSFHSTETLHLTNHRDLQNLE